MVEGLCLIPEFTCRFGRKILLRLENNESRCKLQAVTGVFSDQASAQRAADALRAQGVSSDHVTLLTPGDVRSRSSDVAEDAAEQPGIGKAIGAVVGAAGGFSGGTMLIAAMLPGIGMVTAAGLLGAAVLSAAGAAIGAAAGSSLDNSLSQGLPEDEIFVYEDALRKGRSVVIAMANGVSAESIRKTLTAQGAESVDAARHQWWIGLRSAEREHYSTTGRNFEEDEKFYRLGFEDALHARSRCKEFDQISAEMESRLEDIQKQNPGTDVSEAYARGYQRGRDYYQRFCEQSKAA